MVKRNYFLEKKIYVVILVCIVIYFIKKDLLIFFFIYNFFKVSITYNKIEKRRKKYWKEKIWIYVRR